MHSRPVLAMSLLVAASTAFRDTSPFFAYSSSPILNLQEAFGESTQAALSTTVQSGLKSITRNCPSDAYLIIQQSEVSADDFKASTSAPHLSRRLLMAESSVQSSVIIPDVFGIVDLDTFKQDLVERCKVHTTKLDVESGVIGSYTESPQLIVIDLPALPTKRKARADKLREHDSFVNAVFSLLEDRSYTAIFATSPPSNGNDGHAVHPVHMFEFEEAPFTDALHEDFRRDLKDHDWVNRAPSISLASDSKRPLFETYTFLNAGVFSGAIAAVILLSILYVAISAVAGIEVSYSAFSKEMGPSAQRKQQQGAQQAAQ